MRESRTFNVARLRYLAEDGTLDQKLPDWLTLDLLQQAYETMHLVRTFDTKAIALQRTGKLGTYPSNLGQEAISTAIGMMMDQADILAPYYRDVGAQIQRGVRMEEILAYWGGDERGSAWQDCPHDFPITVPIATQLSHAAGAAAALKIRGCRGAVVATCGDGATSKGDFLETINLAGVWHLPLVTVINNNQWAISVPRVQQCHAPTLAQKAIGAGIEGVEVDGNDIIGLLITLHQALDKARSGQGATLVEAHSYRLCDHTTADDASRYRPDADLQAAWKREPLARLRRWLEQQGAWDPQAEARCVADCKARVEAAVESYLKRKPEPATAMFDHLYAALPAACAGQYEELSRLYPA